MHFPINPFKYRRIYLVRTWESIQQPYHLLVGAIHIDPFQVSKCGIMETKHISTILRLILRSEAALSKSTVLDINIYMYIYFPRVLQCMLNCFYCTIVLPHSSIKVTKSDFF